MSEDWAEGVAATLAVHELFIEYMFSRKLFGTTDENAQLVLDDLRALSDRFHVPTGERATDQSQALRVMAEAAARSNHLVDKIQDRLEQLRREASS